MHPSLTHWPANGIVGVERESTRQRMHATSRDRLESKTWEERGARLQQARERLASETTEERKYIQNCLWTRGYVTPAIPHDETSFSCKMVNPIISPKQSSPDMSRPRPHTN